MFVAFWLPSGSDATASKNSSLDLLALDKLGKSSLVAVLISQSGLPIISDFQQLERFCRRTNQRFQVINLTLCLVSFSATDRRIRVINSTLCWSLDRFLLSDKITAAIFATSSIGTFASSSFAARTFRYFISFTLPFSVKAPHRVIRVSSPWESERHSPA